MVEDRASRASKPPLRIGNCSGFYGDRLTAMREMLEDGPLDVLTGDYLAELTMLILGRDRLKDPSLGYARTFVRQVEGCLALALDGGVKLVANAGGLNPAGLAAKLGEIASAQGLSPSIAYVDGDDLAPRAAELGFGGALTANAYLGGFGIAAALAGGADVVVTGRVTDASLVVGPSVWHHGWTHESYDELAMAVVAGHVIECGPQATGGNFSGFRSMVPTGSTGGSTPLGFPIAEVASDGSSVITKHPGTGGMVTEDTVTAQLMYEIQDHRYLGPDVTTDLALVGLERVGDDRVAITGERGLGGPPPEQLKVCVNELGGFRNSVSFVLTGMDVEAKADWVRAQLTPRLTVASVTWTLGPLPAADADTEEGASCVLRCDVRDRSADPVGRQFTGPAVELALASYPGFTMTGPPGPATPYGVYRAGYVDRTEVCHTVTHADGRAEVIPGPVQLRRPGTEHADGSLTREVTWGPTRRVPLGTFVHARSGDKGGDANLGLWVAHDGSPAYDRRGSWLLSLITPAFVVALLPEAEGLEVDVVPFLNLGGVNVVLHGLLGEGVAASTRFDPQAKGLGEWARSRYVEVPVELL